MGSFMSKHSAAAREKKALLGSMPIDNKASALNYGKKTINPNVDTSDNPSRIETTVMGDLPDGGYSKKQKNLALAQAYATAAQKKDKEKKDPRKANREWRANTKEGQSIERYDPRSN